MFLSVQPYTPPPWAAKLGLVRAGRVGALPVLVFVLVF